MTAFEITKKELQGYNVTDEAIKYALLRSGINENENIDDISSFVNGKEFELMKAQLLLDFVLSSYESWSQGDRSVKSDFETLKRYISGIYAKYGKRDPFADLEKKPKVWKIS